ncbi:MAG: YncE family protein, partial [Vampirovibrionia bacterium]
MKLRLLVVLLALLMCFNSTIENKIYADAGGTVEETGSEVSYISTYSLSLVDNNSIEVAGNPQRPAIAPNGEFILIPAKDFNLLYYVKVINNKPVLQELTIPTGKGPTDVAISKYANKAYVANKFGNSITIIDLDEVDPTIITEIPVGLSPTSLALNPLNQYLYVVNEEDNTVSVIKLDDKDSKIVNTIKVGMGPNSIKLSNDAKSAFVVNRGDNTVTEIDLTNPEGSVTKECIQVGTYPSDITVSNKYNIALITNTLDNNIGLFDPMDSLSAPIGQIKDISKPFGITKSTK